MDDAVVMLPKCDAEMTRRARMKSYLRLVYTSCEIEDEYEEKKKNENGGRGQVDGLDTYRLYVFYFIFVMFCF